MNRIHKCRSADFNNLQAFIVAARERGFTRAAAVAGRVLHAPQGHHTLSMNVKSTGVRENSDGSVGRESAAP
jgi:hypothetical protein